VIEFYFLHAELSSSFGLLRFLLFPFIKFLRIFHRVHNLECVLDEAGAFTRELVRESDFVAFFFASADPGWRNFPKQLSSGKIGSFFVRCAIVLYCHPPQNSPLCPSKLTIGRRSFTLTLLFQIGKTRLVCHVLIICVILYYRLGTTCGGSLTTVGGFVFTIYLFLRVLRMTVRRPSDLLVILKRISTNWWWNVGSNQPAYF